MAPHTFAYLDDIVVCTTTFQEHIEVLAKVFQKLYDARLKANPEKCQFFRAELKYLGHIVEKDGLRTDPEKVAAIKNLPPSKDLKEARRFLGLISWYRRFIRRRPYSRSFAPSVKEKGEIEMDQATSRSLRQT